MIYILCLPITTSLWAVFPQQNSCGVIPFAPHRYCFFGVPKGEGFEMPAPLRPRLQDNIVTKSGKVLFPFSFVTAEDGDMKRCHSFAVEPGFVSVQI